jgi:SHAQKYF class myb-like DNA-binding protein
MIIIIKSYKFKNIKIFMKNLKTEGNEIKFLRIKTKPKNYLHLPESYLSNASKGILNGRWTLEEHKKFIFRVFEWGGNWKKITEFIGTRNPYQVRSHCQKFFKKLKKSNFPILDRDIDSIENLQHRLKIMKYNERLTLQDLLINAHLNCEVLKKESDFNLKYEEIESILGTSVGALKASYHHAVKKIEQFVRLNLNQ